MKISTVLLVVSTLHIFANGVYSQAKEFSLNATEATVGQVLKQIEAQSDYYFLFNQKLVDTEREVNLRIRSQSIDKILEQLFAGTDTDYAVIGRQIVLSPKEYLNEINVRTQPITVKGTVRDEEGLPLVGATVNIKGTTTGTITDIQGNYSLEVPSGEAVLVFSSVGYTSQEIIVGAKTEINLTLVTEIEELEEVIVIGYGTVKKSDLTGSIASVSSEDLENANPSSFSDAIQGRAAGVTVVQNQGAPGSSGVIRIRGIGTVNNNEPLYVVDGVFIDDYNHINPTDIESLEVLKDASAQAIYGSRAANGVILITTKKGKAGHNDFSFNASWGLANPIKLVQTLDRDQFYNYRITALENGLFRTYPNLDPENTDIFEVPTSAGDNARATRAEYEKGYYTDWQKEIVRKNALEQKYDLSYSGGTEKSIYALSAGFLNQNGIIHNSNYQRLTIRLNTQFKPAKFISFGENLGLFYGSTDIISPLDGASITSLFTSSYLMDPLVPVINPDADPNDPDYEYNKYGFSEITEAGNPVAEMNRIDHNLKTYSLTGNAFVELNFLDGLKFRSSIGIDLALTNENDFNAIYYLGSYDYEVTGGLVSANNNRLRWLWENTISYDRTFKNHSISAVAGYTAESNSMSSLSGQKTHISTNDPLFRVLDGITDPNSIITVAGTKSLSTMASLLARVNYVYGERYLFTASVRRDGTSKFGPGYKYGVFPSFALGWRLSKEGFFTNLNQEFISDVKFRAGWGQIGNQSIGDYGYLSLISTEDGYKYPLGIVPELQLGANLQTVGTPDIRWETTVQTNIGIDLGFIKNALLFNFDYYERQTRDMLLHITLPTYVGYTTNPIQNVGTVSNKGFEAVVSYKGRVGDFSYNISGNFSKFINEVTNLKSGILVGTSPRGTAINRTEEGSSIARFYGYVTDGIFQNEAEIQEYSKEGVLIQPDALPGDVRFKDVNDDGIINDQDETWIGSPLPDFTYGLNLDLDFKGITLTAFFIGSYGQDVFDLNRTQGLLGNFNTALYMYEGAWRGDGTSQMFPIISTVDLNNNWRTSDLMVQDASFMRLKNLQIGYNLPQKLCSKIYAKKLRLWVGGTNLFTVTKYEGVDPEEGIPSGATAISTGAVYSSYPTPRYISFGINATF